MKAKPVSIWAILFLFVGGLFFFAIQKSSNDTIASIKEHGVSTQATVIDSEAAYLQRTKYTVSYIDQSGEEEIITQISPSSGLSVGQSVMLTYDSRNPRRAILANSQQGVALYVGAIIMVVCGFIGIYLRVNKISL